MSQGFADHAGTNGYDMGSGGLISAEIGNSLSMILGSGGSGGVGWNVPSTTTIGLKADDSWQHVALVVDRTNAKYTAYIDGVAETAYTWAWNSVWADGTIPGTVGNIKLDGADLQIGIKNGNSGFQGVMDDYAIYDIALTPEMVGGLADGSRTPPTVEVPEPSTVLLAAFGLFGLAFIRRRR